MSARIRTRHQSSGLRLQPARHDVRKEIRLHPRVVRHWVVLARFRELLIRGGTELLLTHERFADEQSREGHAKGWNSTLEKLERQVAG